MHLDFVSPLRRRVRQPELGGFVGFVPEGEVERLARAARHQVEQRRAVLDCRVHGPGQHGPAGAAPFTNYGAHVRACAPAVGIVSAFYRARSAPNAPWLDPFDGFARWDGTSFATPIVGAELVWESAVSGLPIGEVVRRRIDEPDLLRVAGLGAVVNLR